MRRLFAAVTLLTIGSLAACGSSASPGATGTSTSGAGATTSAATTGSAAGGGTAGSTAASTTSSSGASTSTSASTTSTTGASSSSSGGAGGAPAVVDPKGAYLATFGKPLVMTDAPLWQALMDPDLDGVYIRTAWATVEPQQGTYDFSQLVSDILAASAAGKRVSINVSAGSSAPAWLCAQAGACLDFVIIPEEQQDVCNGAELPIPWNAKVLPHWLALIDALAAELKAKGAYNAVSLVKITGLNSETDETRLQSTPSQMHACTSGSACAAGMCTSTDGTTIWGGANGGSYAVIQTTWQTIANEYHKVFPDKALDYQAVPKGFPFDPNDTLTPALIAYGEQTFPGFVVQDNGLNATGGIIAYVSAAETAGYTTGFQTAFYVFGDAQCRMKGSLMNIPAGTCPCSVLDDAVSLAVSKKAKFIEFYVQDVNGCAASIKTAHTTL